MEPTPIQVVVERHPPMIIIIPTAHQDLHVLQPVMPIPEVQEWEAIHSIAHVLLVVMTDLQRTIAPVGVPRVPASLGQHLRLREVIHPLHLRVLTPEWVVVLL